eukprot:746283-Hanusia_phi.AAC.2
MPQISSKMVFQMLSILSRFCRARDSASSSARSCRSRAQPLETAWRWAGEFIRFSSSLSVCRDL